MHVKRKITALLPFVLVALIVGCPSFAADKQTAFTPKNGFSGHSEGNGSLELLFGKPRPFHVESHGSQLSDGTFRLEQTVTFQGKPPERRVWIISTVSPNHYSGTLSDAAGPMTGSTIGPRLFLEYRVTGPLVMHQALELLPDGKTIDNVGTITLLGMPVGHLRETIRLKPARPSTASPPPQISPNLPDGSTTIVEKGKRIATLLGCHGCHDKDLQGHLFIDEPHFARLYSSNLTRALPHYNDQQLDYAIREGVRPDGSPLWEMPSEAFTPLSAPDMLALIAYLRSVPGQGAEHPRVVFGPGGEQEIRTGLTKPAPAKVREERHISPLAAGQNHEWGRYLVHVVCGECHGPDLRGNPDPETYRPDLIVAAAYPLADFKTLLKTGKPLGDRTLTLMAKVAKSRFSHLTDAEVQAMHGYLVARAAVHSTKPD